MQTVGNIRVNCVPFADFLYRLHLYKRYLLYLCYIKTGNMDVVTEYQEEYRAKSRRIFRDTRILALRPGQYRLKLLLNDLTNVEVVGIEKRRVGVFPQNPIRYGRLGVFYRKPAGRSGTMLMLLLRRLVYLNPGIDAVGLKLLTSSIIPTFVAFQGNEPVLNHHEFVLKYREVEGSLYNRGWFPEEVPSDMVVAYPYDSELTTVDRKRISSANRIDRMKGLYGEMIHNAAEIAIEQKSKYLQVGKASLLPYTRQGSPPVRTMRTLEKHIELRTEVMLEESDSSGDFKTVKTVSKYLEYLALPEGTSSNKACNVLRVSRSTIRQFKDLKNKEGDKDGA